ncbi:MAG TPA: PH domain-containing protein [Candidatus Saccharimonadales bacterium]|nr:PH domain-containing protein [Candidatus Saccharimonadales bacterium]
MNPKEQQQNIQNPLTSMQTGERNICEVKRHPFGMLTMYISAGFMLVLLAVIIFLVAPIVFPNTDKSQIYSYGGAIFLIFAVLTLAFVFVSHIVYWGNRWILTSDSLTQVQQRSLFDKQNSQLSLGNLEDVTASQDGILAHMFGFGTLRVETAGERSKFVFPFCPKPNYYAQQILSAREQFEQKIESNEGAGKAYPTGVNTGTAEAQPVASYQVPTDEDLKS